MGVGGPEEGVGEREGEGGLGSARPSEEKGTSYESLVLCLGHVPNLNLGALRGHC